MTRKVNMRQPISRLVLPLGSLRATSGAVGAFPRLSSRLTALPLRPFIKPQVISTRSFSSIHPRLLAKPTAPASTPAKHTQYVLPARIMIYSVGMGRFVYLGLVKFTITLMSCSMIFFGAPMMLEHAPENPELLAASMIAGGIFLLTFITYLSSPLVAFLHLHLPPAARISHLSLTTYVKNLPPTALLDITTLSPIAKPRSTTVEASALRLAIPRRRMGIVDYVRTDESVAREEEQRRWWMFRAVRELSISGRNRGVKEGWVWEELKGRLERVAVREAGVRAGRKGELLK